MYPHILIEINLFNETVQKKTCRLKKKKSVNEYSHYAVITILFAIFEPL